MKDNLLIIGAGGHGRVVADIALKMNKWKSIAFLDDNEFVGTSMGIKVIDTTRNIHKYIDTSNIFVAVGNNIIRKTIFEELKEKNIIPPTLIHPNAIIGSDVEIEAGTVVMAGAIINSSTTIGKGCIINTSSSLDHDNHIGDYVHVSPGVRTAGNVTVGDRSWIGIGSILSNNVELCKDLIVGAGAVVVKDIKEVGTYLGIPAKRVVNKENIR